PGAAAGGPRGGRRGRRPEIAGRSDRVAERNRTQAFSRERNPDHARHPLERTRRGRGRPRVARPGGGPGADLLPDPRLPPPVVLRREEDPAGLRLVLHQEVLRPDHLPGVVLRLLPDAVVAVGGRLPGRRRLRNPRLRPGPGRGRHGPAAGDPRPDAPGRGGPGAGPAAGPDRPAEVLDAAAAAE